MAEIVWLITLLMLVPLFYKSFGIIQLQIITVNMGNKSGVDITIPCGGRDPPYTYIHSESAVVAENINEYYIATDQYPPNNGEKYCCATNGGVTCYQLNITYSPYIPYEKLIGILPSAVLGEPYDIECPYESNPPAKYEWSRVPSCGTTGEPLSWPTHTILLNNNQTLRLDGVQPFHYGYYNCSAANALGSGWFCWWRKVDVCSQVKYYPPDVELQSNQSNITVELHEKVTINCTVRSIAEWGNIEWKHNNSIINGSDSTKYDQMLCGYTSTVVINNFTRAHEGLYTCNASQPNNNSSSDSVYVLIEIIPPAVCDVDHFQPEVKIRSHSKILIVELDEMFEMNCTARNIGKEGRIQWQFNDTLIESCTRCNVQVITNEYDAENCSFVSTVIIKTFTIINQGVYTCNAS